MWSVFRSKLFRKFLRRYLLILCVSGVLLLVTNIISLTNTFNRLTENTHRSMAHAAELLDKRMLDLQELTLFVTRDPKMMPYQLKENLSRPYLISDELVKMKAFSDGLDSVGIFYRNTMYSSLENIIFTDTGMYSPESYAQLIGQNMIVPESFRGMLEQLTTPVLLSSLSNGDNPGGTNQILLLLVPLSTTGYSNGIMVYKLNYSALLKNFQQTIGRESSLLVFDHHGTPIVYLPGDPTLDYSELAGVGQNPDLRIPGYLFLQETSEKQQFHVVNAIRQSVYYHDYYMALTTSIGIILLSLVLGLALSFQSARKSYQPIQELSSSFSPMPPENLDKIDKDGDELAQLSIYIQQMRDESISMSNKMNNQEVLSRNHLMQAVLMGKLNVDNTNEANRSALQKYFGGRKTSSVLVILFDDFNTKLSKEPLSEQWLLKYVIGNVFENLSGEHGVNYALDLAVDNGIVGIVSWRNKYAEEWEARSRGFAEIIQNFMKRHFSLSLSCAIGELQPTEELHQSFNSALTIAEYRIFAGKQSVISPSEVAQQKAIQPEEDKRQVTGLVTELSAAVSSRDSDKLQELTQELEERFIWLEDAASFRLAYLQIVFNLNQFVNNIPLAHREAIKYKLESLAEYQPETIKEACARLLDAASSVQDSLGEAASDDRLYSCILDYVADHYMDCNLSLSMVAEKLSLTPSYVTRYFKNKNGLPLMQYVSKVRIEKAKEWLATSQLPIKEIVEQVGFVDENNFSRAFRKREGVSPTKYRALHQDSMTLNEP